MNNKLDVMIKKTLLTVLSCALVAIGVSLFLQSTLGSDPISVFLDGIRRTFGITFGTAQLMYNAIFLAIALVFARKYILFGTVAGSIITGPLMIFFEPVVQSLVGTQPDLATRFVMIALGEILLCMGIGMNLAAKFGFGAQDAILMRLYERYRYKYRNLKILSDTVHVIVGILLGGVFGIGSVLGVVAGGPLISFFMNLINNTLIRALRLNEFTVKVR